MKLFEHACFLAQLLLHALELLRQHMHVGSLLSFWVVCSTVVKVQQPKLDAGAGGGVESNPKEKVRERVCASVCVRVCVCECVCASVCEYE